MDDRRTEGGRLTAAEFYGLLIHAWISKRPDGRAGSLREVQEAFDMPKELFETAVRWCVENGYLTILPK